MTEYEDLVCICGVQHEIDSFWYIMCQDRCVLEQGTQKEPGMKTCPRCLQHLSEKRFNWKIKGTVRATYCKTCSRTLIKAHYKQNTAYYLKKAQKRNEKVRLSQQEYIAVYLQDHHCIDCGETDILVLEFDHKDRTTKSDAVGNLIKRGFPLRKVIKEITKCEVRCANCHRRKTARENNSWKLKYAPVA